MIPFSAGIQLYCTVGTRDRKSLGRTIRVATLKARSLPCPSVMVIKSPDRMDPSHFAMLDKDYYGGSTSGTDHAQFRQYANMAGRWMRPDPYGGSYDPTNPQSMNRYAYALNNPMSFVDPLGLIIEDCSDGSDCTGDGSGGGDGGGDGSGGDGAGGGGGFYPGTGSSGDSGGTPVPVNCGSSGCSTDQIFVFVDGSDGGPLPPMVYSPAPGYLFIVPSAPNKGSLLHRAVCGAFSWLTGAASATNSTMGIGAGGNGGVGFILGIAASGGVQVVADSSGNLGVAITVGGNPGYGVFGVGDLALRMRIP